MNEASATETGPTWIAIVHLTVLPAWLSLPRERRHQVIAEQVNPLLAAHPEVTTTWVDVEAFSAASSDVIIARTASPQAWNHLFEALRDTDLFAVPYVHLDAILSGIENGYQLYEDSLARTTTGR